MKMLYGYATVVVFIINPWLVQDKKKYSFLYVLFSFIPQSD